jgi:hypothetical protein
MMGRLKSDQGQLFYEFHLGDAVPARPGHGADQFVSGSAWYPLALRTQSNVTRMKRAADLRKVGGVLPTLHAGSTKARLYDRKYGAARGDSPCGGAGRKVSGGIRQRE